MKKRIILSIAFIASLLPMQMNQFGGRKGISEISGTINLLNPIGILSVLIFAVGVWVPFKKKIIGLVLGAVGTAGIVVSEVYNFFTWYTLTITHEISLETSLSFAFPEFYLGLAVSLFMIIAYFVINKVIKD